MSTHRRLLQALSIIVVLTMLFSSFSLPSASAQGKDGLKREVNPQTGKVSFLGPESGRALSARALGISAFVRPQDPGMALAQRFAPEFGLKDPARDLIELKTNRSEDGRLAVRYQQSYQGIPVMGGELMVNTNENGDLYSMNGEVSADLSLPTQPTVDSEQAQRTAFQAAAKWYQKAPENFVATEPQLWIYDESLLQPSNRAPELVWRMEVTTVDISLPVRELVLVNAERGHISLHFNQVDTAWGGTETEKTFPTSSATQENPKANVDRTTPNSTSNAPAAQTGGTWYVATTGDDSNSCDSPVLPCATINSAIGKAAGGDTILIGEGLYFNSPSINKPLTLSGGWNDDFSSQSGISILDGKKDTNRSSVLYITNNATIDHLLMQNGRGGISVSGSPTVLIRQSSVYGNSDVGIRNGGGNLSLENSTVSGNGDSGIYGGGTINIINSTITENFSGGNPSTGGIFFLGSIFIQNSILSGNTKDGTPSDCYGFGTITSLGNNIIGTTSGCSLTPQPSDLVGVDPQMGPFLGSGYHALSSNSPAIEAGNVSACPASDQRGVSRLADVKCDIGAYEYTAPGSAAKVMVQSGSYQVPGQNMPLSIPLKALVLDSVGSPVAGESVTFLAPASGASGIFADSGTNQTSAMTDSNGIASASSFTTNSIPGTFEITAAVNGLSQTAMFFITYTALYVKLDGNNNLDCLTPSTACATINGALGKAPSNAKIFVAGGTYTGIGYDVVLVNKSTFLSGGWNAGFSTQNEQSIIDGQNSRGGISVSSYGYVVNIDHFIVKNSGTAIENGLGSTTTLFNSSLLDNGTGAYNQGTLNIKNTTIGQNSSYGIENHHTLTTIQNSTIVNNGSGIYSGSNVFVATTIQNSILAKNGKNCVINAGSITSIGYNLVDSITGCSMTTVASDLIGSDPRVVPLPSLGLYILAADSPAIDTANLAGCPATDQRGITRPQGSGCDIGAYEYVTPGTVASLAIVSGNNQRTAPNVAVSEPLKVAAFDNQGGLVSGVSITFTAPDSGASGIFADTPAGTTTVLTDTNGIATTPLFTANANFGTYTITASASGAGSVSFSLQNFALYVATTGNNSNSCLLPSSPCATIQGAINKATAGDPILVATGVYTDTSSRVVNIDKSVKLSGGWNISFTAQSGLSTIDGQNARQGVYNTGMGTTLDRFIVKNGTSSDGGGIYNPGYNLTINNSSIQNNSANLSLGFGGGIYNYGHLTLNNTTVTNNSASRGGGVGNEGGLILNNSTISNNSAAYGGGIYNEGDLMSNSTTISDNSATFAGGGVHNISTDGGESLQNSILAQNMAEGSPDCYGTFGSSGYNLIGDNSYCTFAATTGDLVGTVTSPINPRLNPLQDNGGLNYTQALGTGSPAIDAGSPATPGSNEDACPETDQRGVTRPIGARCDIGAFEGSVNWVPNLVSTYTAGNGSSLPGTFLCNQFDPNCAAGDAHAKAAHKYAIGTYNLYVTQYGRDSIDNNGMTIISSVHYSSNYANAFWNGDQMVYGDKYGFPLADDVVAHELTHGVTQYESNLFYYYQSGAINESLSDLWGEYYDQTNGLGNDAPDVKWLQGEDISGYGAHRNMSNPPAFGDPDKMTSVNYYLGTGDNGGVHYNSGVNNKAVFLMVDGGTFNGKTVTGLGWDKTATIYYEANTNLLTSGADYWDLYYVLQQACSNLIGQEEIAVADCAEVKDALDAVEMNTQLASNFNSDAPYCSPYETMTTTVFSDDLESGTGNWSFNNGAYTRWQWDSPYGPYAHSGEHFLYADDYPVAVTDASARLASVTIPNNAYLRFAHAYEFETFFSGYYDGGVLEYSINGGTAWLDAGSLIDYNGYKGTLYSGYGNPLSGRSASVGTSHGYISTRVNLASLAGKTVNFRWRMGLDSSIAVGGWWVDDVEIYQCQDVTPPDVSSILRASSNPTSATSVYFSVTFSEPVNNVDPGDFILDTTGEVDDAAIREVTGWGNTYTVKVNTGTGAGTLRLDVRDTASITDPAGNVIENVPFTSGEAYALNSGPRYDLGLSRMGDFNGDGKAEIAIFRPSTSTWYINGVGTFLFGGPGDIPVVADYNGDGRDDMAIFRPSTSTWYIAGVGNFLFGGLGDIPVVGDYNGDRKADIAIFRPSTSTWYINGVGTFLFGGPGDIPVVGDYNGDGRDDMAIFRPSTSTWYINGVGTFLFGGPGDIPVVGDYNGDRKADIAIFRPSTSTWYINGVGTFLFGGPGDIPVVADYNGDRKADLAIFRSSTSTWYINGVGTFLFGGGGDIPI